MSSNPSVGTSNSTVTCKILPVVCNLLMQVSISNLAWSTYHYHIHQNDCYHNQYLLQGQGQQLPPHFHHYYHIPLIFISLSLRFRPQLLCHASVSTSMTQPLTTSVTPAPNCYSILTFNKILTLSTTPKSS